MKIDINIEHNLTTHCKELCVYCVTRDCNEKLDKILHSQGIDPVIQHYADQMVCIGCGLKQNVCNKSCNWHCKEYPIKHGKIIEKDGVVQGEPFKGFDVLPNTTNVRQQVKNEDMPKWAKDTLTECCYGTGNCEDKTNCSNCKDYPENNNKFHNGKGNCGECYPDGNCRYGI